MNGKAKIKVIKKDQIKEIEKPAIVEEKRSNRKAAREMVSNVTNWVTEFQRSKREETKVAFENLFAARARISES